MHKHAGDWKSTEEEERNRENFYELFKNTPIAKDELLYSLGLFINRQSWSRMLFLHEISLWFSESLALPSFLRI